MHQLALGPARIQIHLVHDRRNQSVGRPARLRRHHLLQLVEQKFTLGPDLRTCRAQVGCKRLNYQS